MAGAETEADAAGGGGRKRRGLGPAWRDARRIIWENRRRLGLGLLLIGVNRVASLVLPAVSKLVIDEIVGRGRGELLGPVALAVVGATILQTASSFTLSQLLGVAAQRSITEMRRNVQAHITRLPIRHFDTTQSGIQISRIMTDAEGIRNLVGTGIVQLVGGLLTATVAIGVLFWLNAKLTLIMIGVMSLFGIAMAWSFKALRPLFRERGRLHAEVTGRLNQTLGGIRVVKAYTAEKHEERVFTKGVNELFRYVAKSMTVFSATMAVSALTFGVIGALMIYIGGHDILAGRMTLGDFIMFTIFIALVAGPLVQIAQISTQLSEALAGLDRIREVKGLPDEAEEDRELRPLKSVRGDITFENVSFEYNPGEPVLEGISLFARAGTTTALVGPSGSGKSTLISLVMAFNRPTKGRIILDGHDIRNIRLRDYRKATGIVLQDNFLFDGTLRENILYSRPGASDEEMREAARIAHCDEFIDGFKEGYETVIGERGVRLSGGQRQRVAIARAVLADPKILILDEATSHLDSRSEAMIQDGLRTLRKGRTTFVIAHRLSTIYGADQILVLDHGRIVERGTHAALMGNNGLYRAIHDEQLRHEQDSFVNPGEDPDDTAPEKIAAAKK